MFRPSVVSNFAELGQLTAVGAQMRRIQFARRNRHHLFAMTVFTSVFVGSYQSQRVSRNLPKCNRGTVAAWPTSFSVRRVSHCDIIAVQQRFSAQQHRRLRS